MHNEPPQHKEIPDKFYFRIGEVSKITGIPSYVLRFWETEFPGINPKRTSTGQRMYRKSDLELILTIKRLLYENKYTIKGAKKHLKEKSSHKDKTLPDNLIDEIKLELKGIREMLK